MARRQGTTHTVGFHVAVARIRKPYSPWAGKDQPRCRACARSRQSNLTRLGWEWFSYAAGLKRALPSRERDAVVGWSIYIAPFCLRAYSPMNPQLHDAHIVFVFVLPPSILSFCSPILLTVLETPPMTCLLGSSASCSGLCPSVRKHSSGISSTADVDAFAISPSLLRLLLDVRHGGRAVLGKTALSHLVRFLPQSISVDTRPHTGDIGVLRRVAIVICGSIISSISRPRRY